MPPLPDDEWQDLSADIPAKEEPFIQRYISGREALIAQEKKQRSDSHFRQSMSPIALEASEIVGRIRDEEKRTIWTPQLEEDIAQETSTLFPGMMFGLAKTHMEKTKLWQIVRKMPKGALLHAHTDAMVDFDFVFEKLLTTPGIHIFCDEDLSTPEKRNTGAARFQWRKTEGSGPSIWEKEYKPNTFVLATKAAESFPEGGRVGFLSWLKRRMTITNDESLEHHLGHNAVWEKFTTIFPMVDSIIMYEPIFRSFMQRMLSQLHSDGVRWIDLRLAMSGNFYLENDEEEQFDRIEFFRIFGEEIEKYKKSKEGEGFWGCRMIWTGLRQLDTRGIIEDMDACITTKIAFPHLIAGYDLVGQEDGGRPLKDLLPELFWFRKQCAQEKVEIPFFFHAGECLGDGDATDSNLFDAILLGTRRIGHGFSLYKHPLLIDMVKEKKILIESCPISNEVLRLTASVMSHPLPALLARGVTCSLCNDDPAILGQDTAGMSHDFWQALQGWENLGLAGLGSLAENSVRYAAFEDQNAQEWLKDIKEASVGKGIKAERMREWSVEWEQFCFWIVEEFGEAYGSDDGKDGDDE